MPKTKISEYSSTANSNTDIASINIDEGCAPSGINNAIRAVMGHLKDFQAGTNGDSFNGPVGTSTAAAGAFTTLSASGNVTLGDASTDTFNVGNGGLVKDASGNVGIGTSSPVAKLDLVSNSSALGLRIRARSIDDFGYLQFTNNAGTTTWSSIDGQNGILAFNTGASDTERARIDSSGNLLVGTTSRVNSTSKQANWVAAGAIALETNSTSTAQYYPAIFYNNTATAGYITVTGTVTSYISVSDYRLKENVQPMTDALSKIAALKPCTYNWKTDGSEGQGFIAHELKEVVPDSVSGEKDAVDADGNPVYQGIDTSFLVATLTAAIQEQQALITQQAAALTTLTERITALEGTKQ